MSVYNWIAERLALPASDLVLRRTIARHREFLEVSQWWSGSDLVEYQNEKLRELVRHAYDNVELYREIFDQRRLRPSDIKTRDDLRKLPILSKQQLRAQPRRTIVDNAYPAGRIIPHKSSGSTGEPFQYSVSNDAYSYNIACNLRGWYWMGYRLGDRFVKISQYDRPFQKRLQDQVLRTTYVSSADLSDPAFERLVEKLRRLRPKVVRCYPDPLFFLADYMARHDIDDLRPEVITTTGSVLLPGVREVVQERFGCPVFDSYRCEGGANAFEAPGHDCYLSSMEYGISEVVGDDGDEVAPGRAGRLVSTDLHNYAQPFIRYDSQDVVVKAETGSACGRQHLAFAEIHGRASDILVTPSGKYLIAIHFVDYFDRFSSVNRFQVVQESARDFLVRLDVNDRFTAEEEDEITRYWQAFVGPEARFEVALVDEIREAPGGKRRFLIRDESVGLGL